MLLLPLPAAAEVPVAIELAIDLERNELRVTDTRSGESFGPLSVAVGSPAHPTPRGTFRVGRVVLNPAWTPGKGALAAGATRMPPSLDSPMGVAKLPFAEGGAIALHGGGDPYVLGKPVSSGCVRAADADLLRLIAWLHLRGALARAVPDGEGALQRDFRPAARLRVR